MDWGGVVPTLNRIDNSGDSFATVLILMEKGEPVIMRNREGCAGGGKGPMYSDKSFTLATANDQILIIDGTRVGMCVCMKTALCRQLFHDMERAGEMCQ